MSYTEAERATSTIVETMVDKVAGHELSVFEQCFKVVRMVQSDKHDTSLRDLRAVFERCAKSVDALSSHAIECDTKQTEVTGRDASSMKSVWTMLYLWNETRQIYFDYLQVTNGGFELQKQYQQFNQFLLVEDWPQKYGFSAFARYMASVFTSTLSK